MENKDEGLDKITIVNEKGEEAVANLVGIFVDDQVDKKYVAYTFNPEVENVDIYASEMIETDEDITFEPIKTQEEWNFVQKEIEKLSM